MATNTIIDTARIVTVQDCDLGNYRLGLVRFDTEKWGRIIAVLEDGQIILVAPVDGSDSFDLPVTGAEFDVVPVASDAV